MAAIRLGMITPSSNTVLEPVCAALLHAMPEISAHFARLRVTEISLTEAANRQFGSEAMVQAAELLADARVQVICWNGTSASWLGVERDRQLCRAIREATGVPATSSVLAMIEYLRRSGFTRVGLVTPYVEAVQQRIVAALASEGFETAGERHLGLTENFAFGAVEPDRIEEMIRELAAVGPQAILVMCTNLRGAPLAARLEAELGVPIVDSAAAAIWGSLRLAGVASPRVDGWGSLFRD